MKKIVVAGVVAGLAISLGGCFQSGPMGSAGTLVGTNQSAMIDTQQPASCARSPVHENNPKYHRGHSAPCFFQDPGF